MNREGSYKAEALSAGAARTEHPLLSLGCAVCHKKTKVVRADSDKLQSADGLAHEPLQVPGTTCVVLVLMQGGLSVAWVRRLSRGPVILHSDTVQVRQAHDCWLFFLRECLTVSPSTLTFRVGIALFAFTDSDSVEPKIVTKWVLSQEKNRQ